MFGNQTSARRPACLNRLKLFAVGTTPANFVDNVAKLYAHFNFNQTRSGNFARKRKGFCALAFFSAKRSVVVGTLAHYRRHRSQSLHIIDVCGLAEQALVCGERRLRPWHCPDAFYRTHKRSFFAANERARALFYSNFKIVTVFIL